MATAIIVGIGEWERYTLPLIQSLQTNSPQTNITVIDNGSPVPYPRVKGVDILREEKTLGYAAALNTGLDWGVDDWYIPLNNDMLIEKPLDLSRLNPQVLYGFHSYSFEGKFEYAPSWCYFLSNEVVERIGLFDEAFRPMWFEDADYCARAQKASIPLVILDRKAWGIRHFEDERMSERKGYMAKHMDARHANRLYLRAKHGI